jgi:hypothetical protein
MRLIGKRHNGADNSILTAPVLQFYLPRVGGALSILILSV